MDLEGHVFLGKDGKPIDKHLDRIWAAALRKSGLRHRSSYQLRHTFASILLHEGIAPGYISKMLGHSNLQTTFRHYARFIDDNRNSEQRIAEALFGVTTQAEGRGTQKGPQSNGEQVRDRA
jgi:integrase